MTKLKFAFRGLDKNTNGRLSFEERKPINQKFDEIRAKVKQDIEDCLDAADDNRNGKIDRPFFWEWVSGKDEVKILSAKLAEKGYAGKASFIDAAEDAYDDNRGYYKFYAFYQKNDTQNGPGESYTINAVRKELSSDIFTAQEKDSHGDYSPVDILTYPLGDKSVGIGNYSSDAVKVGPYEIPAIEITATTDEELLSKRFFDASAEDDKITQGPELVNFLCSFSPYSDNLSMQNRTNVHLNQSSIGRNGYSESNAYVSPELGIDMKTGTGEMDKRRLEILFNETGWRPSGGDAFKPIDVNSPTYVVEWPTGNILPNGQPEKTRKQLWSYGDMFAYYLGKRFPQPASDQPEVVE